MSNIQIQMLDKFKIAVDDQSVNYFRFALKFPSIAIIRQDNSSISPNADRHHGFYILKRPLNNAGLYFI
jgi:hypothetical protein